MATFLSLVYLLNFSLIFYLLQSAFHLFFSAEIVVSNLNGHLLFLLARKFI